MSSHDLEDTMKVLFQGIIPISKSQNGRLARASSGLLLAESVQLPKMANRLVAPVQKAGRVRFLERFFDAPFLSQDLVYQRFLAQFLSKRHDARWHILIDRSTLRGYESELLMLSLAYYGHAIPLVWEVIDFGCTGAVEQIALFQRLVTLFRQILPSQTQVIIQGDTEFGSVAVIQFLCQQGWHFILAQSANTAYRQAHQGSWQLLADLPVTPRHSVYLHNIEWTEQHQYGLFNLFAFYQPHQSSPDSQGRDYRYCLTNLRISHKLRTLGSRRWAIEPFFKDYKSGGFDLESSHFRSHDRWENLLILLSVNYLWLTSLGRWLSKTGQRSIIDPKHHRQLSLFRLGWDWLVSCSSQGLKIPLISTLYS